MAFKFMQSAGQTLRLYVEERRIERAKVLFHDGALRLCDIAAIVGFSSQSDFTTVFRRLTGVTGTQVPKPSSWLLFGTILTFVAFRKRRLKRIYSLVGPETCLSPGVA